MPDTNASPEQFPPLIIAIDGPAGSGKSTTARILADWLGYIYLDTGAMYRALAYTLAQRGALQDEAVADALAGSRVTVAYVDGEMRVLVDGVDVSALIRTPEIGSLASRISRLAAVRDKLLDLQRSTAREHVASGTGVVLDGRDIGTVVFPDADLKIFMVADPEVRARRRQAELLAKGHERTISEVLAEILERDRQDTERPIAPLRKAADAILLDTSKWGLEDQVKFIIDLVRERGHRTSVKNSSR